MYRNNFRQPARARSRVATVGSGLSSEPCDEPDEQEWNDRQPALVAAFTAADEEAGSPWRRA
eukprot:1241273-Lingulodinium_polyedra.AAC.1